MQSLSSSLSPSTVPLSKPLHSALLAESCVYCHPHSLVKEGCDLVWFWTWRNPSETILFCTCKGSSGCSYFPSCNSSLWTFWCSQNCIKLVHVSWLWTPIHCAGTHHDTHMAKAWLAQHHDMPSLLASCTFVLLLMWNTVGSIVHRNPELRFRANSLVKAKKF